MLIPGFGSLTFVGFVKQLYRRWVDHTLPDRAAQLAYYFVFALFPGLAFLVTLAAYLPMENVISSLVARASYVMPDQTVAMLDDQLNELIYKTHPKLLTVGFLIACWSATRGADVLRAALNLAYDVKESRPFWKVELLGLLYTILGAALILTGFTIIVLGGKAGYWIANELSLTHAYLKIWAIVRWPISAALIMLTLALAYYALPDVKQHFKFVTVGSVVSAIAWLGATFGFSAYVGRFGTYNITYGAIGSVIILLSWFYISGMLFILGGEINAIIEQASREGKAAGARSEDRLPEPALERPSIAPPGSAKSAASARRSNKKASGRT